MDASLEGSDFGDELSGEGFTASKISSNHDHDADSYNISTYFSDEELGDVAKPLSSTANLLEDSHDSISFEVLKKTPVLLASSGAANQLMERIKSVSQARLQREATLEVINGLKRSEELLKLEVLKLRSLMDDRNRTFQSLLISESRFQELQSRRADELTTFELACVRSMELCLPLKENLESCRKLTETLTEQLHAERSESQSLTLELSRERKLSAVAKEGFSLEISTIEQRLKRVSALLETESMARRLSEEKAAKYDKVAGENEKLAKEVSDLRLVIEQQGVALTALSASEKEQKVSLTDLTRQCDLLKMDKAFLESELRSAEIRIHDKARTSEGLTAKVLSLENTVSKLTDQLSSVQLKSRSDFDHRMENQISRLREDSQRELDLLKSTSKEIADRETKYLKEALAGYESEIYQLKRENENILRDNKALQTEITTILHDKNQNISFLQAELKMKSFQLTSLASTLEERNEHIRHMESEVDNLREEIHARKAALCKVQNESEMLALQQKLDLDNALKQLRSYELLDKEMGRSIINSSDCGAYNDFLLKSCERTNPENRIRHAVSLAQRLSRVENERNQLAHSLSEKETKIIELNDLVAELQKCLRLVKEPTQFLVNRLRHEEINGSKMSSELSRTVDELKICREEKLQIEETVCMLDQRLRSVMCQRADIDLLTKLLDSWKFDASKPSSISYPDEGISAAIHVDDIIDDQLKPTTLQNVQYPDISGVGVDTLSRMTTRASPMTSRASPQKWHRREIIGN